MLFQSDIHRFKGSEQKFEVSCRRFHVKSLFGTVEIDGKDADIFFALPCGIKKVAFDFFEKVFDLFS